MTEEDKTLIQAYLDGETTKDETSYVESIIQSNNDANNYANSIKQANNAINKFFNSIDTKYLDTSITTFVEKQKKKTNPVKYINNFKKLFFNRRYYAYFASAVLLVIVFLPSFNQDEIKIFEDYSDIPIHVIKNERSEIHDNFKNELDKLIIEYGDKSIYKFRLEFDDVMLMIEIKKYSNNCYFGNIKREDTSDIREFKTCKK